MLDGDDVPTSMRGEFERLRRVALRREELHARISITAREQARITKWQQETLRGARRFLAEVFEANAWMRREKVPFDRI